MAEHFHDELDEHIAESMKDPEYRKAAEESKRWHAEANTYTCPNGCCTSFVHPTDDERQSGWGPVGCPFADDEPPTVRAKWALYPLPAGDSTPTEGAT